MAVVALLRALLVSTLVVVGYFVLPFTAVMDARTVTLLVGGVGLVAGLLAWEIRAIIRSDYPLARGLGAILITVPLYLVVFGTIYFAMGQADPSHWSEPLTRLDAMYFTVTVFATVGFGDIVASSEPTRTLVLVQMIGNLLLLGIITRVIVKVVQQGITRRHPSGPAGRLLP